MHLVGRSEQREAILAALERAGSGAGEVVVLVGGPGSGRTALLTWAAAAAAERGLEVDVLDDADGSDETVARLRALDADQAQHRLVLAASAIPLGLRTELPLPPLTVDEIAALTGGLPPDVARAVRAASRGLPGPALALLAAGVPDGDDTDPVIALALAVSGDVPFLEIDDAVVRLLEAALARDPAPADRAVLLARLARELMGDPTTWSRRARLLREASELADRLDDPGVRAQVVEARLHGLWGPDAAGERADLAGQLVALSREAGDLVLERRGMFWRFVSLMEAGRVGDAESALLAYERASAGDAADRVMVLGRHALIALLRGRYDEAQRLIGEAASWGTGRRPGHGPPDGHPAGSDGRRPRHGRDGRMGATDSARGRPAHARALLRDDAGAAAPRGRAPRRGGRGAAPGPPSAARRLGPAVARGGGARRARRRRGRRPGRAGALYESLLPYSGRLALLGGANSSSGHVDHHLGRLALASGRADAAVTHLTAAESAQRAEGLLPGLARTLAALAQALQARAAPGDEEQERRCLARSSELADRLGMALPAPPDGRAGRWSLLRDGPDWLLRAGDEHARVPDVRGLGYLVTLLRAPRAEVAATALVSGGTPVAPEVAEPVLDAQAIAGYRTRLARLESEADTADRLGDVVRGEQLAAERDAILAELRGGTGLGGRRRTFSTAAERARGERGRRCGRRGPDRGPGATLRRPPARFAAHRERVPL